MLKKILKPCLFVFLFLSLNAGTETPKPEPSPNAMAVSQCLMEATLNPEYIFCKAQAKNTEDYCEEQAEIHYQFCISSGKTKIQCGNESDVAEDNCAEQ